MKTVAIIVIWMMCCFTGFYKTYLLKKRKEELDSLIKTVEYFASSADYEKKTPKEVFATLPESYKIPLTRAIEGSDDIYGAFKQANKNQSFINEKDFSILDMFFSSIGRSDLENQLSLVKKTITSLEENREDARSIYNKYSRLYITSGILVGTLFVILMI
ncbi:MAG: hypothetical protein DBX47_04360 [Clostridiales bacterium]|nr:MAG: hypothetical protein DBX47_04360 [Clostridiales bacterium]